MAFNPNSLSETTIKRFVDKLVQQNKKKETWPPKRAGVQEDVAVMLGYKNWHELSKSIANGVNTTPDHVLDHDIGATPKNLYANCSYDVTSLTRIFSPDSNYRAFIKDGKSVCAALFTDIIKHSLVFGPDESRRSFFQSIINYNPEVRFFVVQGSETLPLPNSKDIEFSDRFFKDKKDAKFIRNIPKSFLQTYLRSRQELMQLNFGIVEFFEVVYETIIEHNIVAIDEEKEQQSLYYYKKYFDCSSAEFKTVYDKMTPEQQNVVQRTRTQFECEHMENILERLTLALPNIPSHLLNNFSHNVGVNISNHEHDSFVSAQILSLIEHWRLSSNKPGVLIFNGVHHTSSIYLQLYRYFSHWGQHNIGVFVGGNSAADLPNDPKDYERLTSRLNWKYTIK